MPEDLGPLSRTSKPMKMQHQLYEHFYNGYRAVMGYNNMNIMVYLSTCVSKHCVKFDIFWIYISRCFLKIARFCCLYIVPSLTMLNFLHDIITKCWEMLKRNANAKVKYSDSSSKLLMSYQKSLLKDWGPAYPNVSSLKRSRYDFGI